MKTMFFALFTAAAVSTAASGCSRIPGTGERHLTLVSEKQEVAMGQQAAEEVKTTIGLYPNEGLQKYVSSLGQSMAKVSERPDLPWSFQVVDDAAVNAFALPGGYIYVTRGLMAHMENEAQLASVIGHEIGHVTGRHSVRMISRAQLAQLGLAVGMAVSETVRSFGQLGSGGLQLLFLKYGRDAEHEADELGFRYTEKLGYDLREVPEVFATLKRVGEAAGGGERLPTWLSTHPAPEDRIESTEKRLAKATATGGKQDASEYLRRLDGMVFGDDPRNGYFTGAAFKHPELKFTFNIPEGWKGANLTQAVMAQSPKGDAAMQLTLVPGASPEQALRQFLTNQAIQQSQVLPAAAVGGQPAASARIVAQMEQGTAAGLVTFVSHGGRTYQLLGLTGQASFAQYEPVFARSTATFAPLTDPAALAVQPARLKIITLAEPTTLAQLQQKSGGGVKVETLALLNGVEPNATLPKGAMVKTVVGTPAAPPVAMSH